MGLVQRIFGCAGSGREYNERMKKDKDKLNQEFYDRKATIVVGLLCLIYFILYFSSNLGGVLASIIPPLPHPIFSTVAGAVFVSQVVIWRILKLFYPRWFLNLTALILFISEYMLSLFVILFVSWPLYFLITYCIRSSHRF